MAIVWISSQDSKVREDILAICEQTMDEVGTALIATSLVLVAVFLPTVLLEGITGQFYKQFGVTIAAATMISTVVSLTLSPAMAAIFMKDIRESTKTGLFSLPSRLFNRFIDGLSSVYGYLVGRLVRIVLIVSVIYVGLIGLTGYGFSQLPTGFIPPQDQGFTITIVNLPPGASLDRSDAVVRV